MPDDLLDHRRRAARRRTLPHEMDLTSLSACAGRLFCRNFFQNRTGVGGNRIHPDRSRPRIPIGDSRQNSNDLLSPTTVSSMTVNSSR